LNVLSYVLQSFLDQHKVLLRDCKPGFSLMQSLLSLLGNVECVLAVTRSLRLLPEG
jgi:hypothetical protein